MQKFARFAVTFLEAALALSVFGADLRPVKDPAKIDAVFPQASKIRMLNVWATWCIPCVLEMPDLRAIDEQFGAELAVAGVSMDDMIPGAKPEAVASFLDRYRVAFPNVYYTGSADALGERLRFDGEIPVTILYDARGKELWRHQGRIDRDATIARLRELLKTTTESK
jgi:thiol-disulfide isomerase/thioredoxin